MLQKVTDNSKISVDFTQMEILFDHRETMELSHIESLLQVVSKKWLNKKRIKEFIYFEHESKLILRILDAKDDKICAKCDLFLQIILYNNLNLIIIDQIDGLGDLLSNYKAVSLCLRLPALNERFIEDFLPEYLEKTMKIFSKIVRRGEERSAELLPRIKILRQLTYQNPDLIEERGGDCESLMK